MIGFSLTKLHICHMYKHSDAMTVEELNEFVYTHLCYFVYVMNVYCLMATRLFHLT